MISQGGSIRSVAVSWSWPAFASTVASGVLWSDDHTRQGAQMEHQTNLDIFDERERFGGAFNVERDVQCAISIIDARLLLSQCFLLALRLSDPNAVCNVYTSIAEWSAVSEFKRDQIVILFEVPSEGGGWRLATRILFLV